MFTSPSYRMTSELAGRLSRRSQTADQPAHHRLPRPPGHTSSRLPGHSFSRLPRLPGHSSSRLPRPKGSISLSRDWQQPTLKKCIANEENSCYPNSLLPSNLWFRSIIFSTLSEK